MSHAPSASRDRPSQHPSSTPHKHWPACTAQQLLVTAKDWGFTMPGDVANIGFRNTGRTTCTLSGWPKVRVVRATTGRPVTTRISYDRGDSQLGPVPVKTIPLEPGASAKSGLLVWPGGGCTGRSFKLLIKPPGVRTQTVLAERGDAFSICSSRSSISVTPVRG